MRRRVGSAGAAKRLSGVACMAICITGKL
jgi:hypothetical protein